jgi:hypothetical protein
MSYGLHFKNMKDVRGVASHLEENGYSMHAGDIFHKESGEFVGTYADLRHLNRRAFLVLHKDHAERLGLPSEEGSRGDDL